MIRKLFHNVRITTPCDIGAPLAGTHQGSVQSFEKGALLCKNGRIESIGNEKEVIAVAASREVDVEIDCERRCMIPGFVDPHTHMCFAERREQEFDQRMAGMDYLEILRSGGGILSSVRSVRECAEEELFSITRRNALSALRHGTTTLEIKSGYGLQTETELKMLRVIERVGRETPLDVVSTFMGAHAIPEEYAELPNEYVDLLIRELIPAVREQGIAKFCDVFCEKNVFSLEQSRLVLQTAKDAGLKLKIHADEVYDLGGAGLAADLQATSADHLLAANEQNLRAMSDQGVIGVLLPGTAYSLRKAFAPARKMVELGVPLALATDCNPGSSYTESMPFVFGLAVLSMGLSISEALIAATLNAAYAIQAAECSGSLDVGKSADFLILDGQSPAVIAYHSGVSCVDEVYKKGELVASY